jgi:hypothetical protein
LSICLKTKIDPHPLSKSCVQWPFGAVSKA